MPDVVNTRRRPLFGRNTVPPKQPVARPVQRPTPVTQDVTPSTQLPGSDTTAPKVATPVPSKGQQFIKEEDKSKKSKKLWISLGIILIAIVTIIMVVVLGTTYTEEAIEKSSLIVPFMFRKNPKSF